MATEIDTRPLAQLGGSCVLVAAQVLTGKPDREVIEAGKAYGWTERHGMELQAIPDYLRGLGLTARRDFIKTEDDTRRRSVSWFELCHLLDPPHILITRRHALLTYKGHAIDPNREGCLAKGREVFTTFRIEGSKLEADQEYSRQVQCAEGGRMEAYRRRLKAKKAAEAEAADWDF